MHHIDVHWTEDKLPNSRMIKILLHYFTLCRLILFIIILLNKLAILDFG